MNAKYTQLQFHNLHFNDYKIKPWNCFCIFLYQACSKSKAQKKELFLHIHLHSSSHWAFNSLVRTSTSQSPFKACCSIPTFHPPLLGNNSVNTSSAQQSSKGPGQRSLKKNLRRVLGEVIISGPVFPSPAANDWRLYPPGNTCLSLSLCRFRPPSPDNTSGAIELIFQFCAAYPPFCCP